MADATQGWRGVCYRGLCCPWWTRTALQRRRAPPDRRRGRSQRNCPVGETKNRPDRRVAPVVKM